MADLKQLLEVARRERASLQQRFDSLPVGKSGTRSSNPQYASLKQALDTIDAEIRRMQGARVRERVAAVGNAIANPPKGRNPIAEAGDKVIDNLFNPVIDPSLRNAPGGLFSQKKINTPQELESSFARAEQPSSSTPLPPYGEAPSDVITSIVMPQTGSPSRGAAMSAGVVGAAPTSEASEMQGPPAPEQAPGMQTPAQGAKPAAALDPHAQQIDADMMMLRGMAAEPVPGMIGPVPLSMGERISAGLIAALDPVSYQAIVLPELARRQQDATLKYQAARSAQDARMTRQAQLLGLQFQQQQLGVEREKLAAGADERAREREQEKTEVVTALSSMLPVVQRADRRVSVVAQGLREVGLGGQADALESQYAEVSDIAKPLAENPMATTKAQVGIFSDRAQALDRSLADAQNAVHSERVRRGDLSAKAKIPSETDLSKYTWGRAALTAIRRARMLVHQGHGGPESVASGALWWTDTAQKHKELSEQWSMIEASVKPDKFGGALSPTENQIINGILAGTLSLPATQIRALERLETIVAGKLSEQEGIFDFRDESAIVGRGYLTQHQLELITSKLSEGWTMASTPEQISGNVQNLEAYDGWVVDPDGYPIMLSPDGRVAKVTPF